MRQGAWYQANLIVSAQTVIDHYTMDNNEKNAAIVILFEQPLFVVIFNLVTAFSNTFQQLLDIFK